jgi:uncharacterized protein DUF4331
VSDHFSGPRALAWPLCDICDFYAFPSPERDGHLVLVMDVLPLAKPSSSFSDAIVYRFRLRPAAVFAVGPAASFAISEKELVFDCVFETPRVRNGLTAQQGQLTTPAGETVPFVVNDAQGGRGSGVRVFAGLRSDPFFIDFDALQESLKTGRLAFTEPGRLTGRGANVLGVVIEIECASMLPCDDGPLFAAVGETVANGKLPIRLERVGRPEVKNLLLSVKAHDRINRDIDVRDLYNLEDPFHVGPDYRGVYRTRMSANLEFLDGLDGKTDWLMDAQGFHPLTRLLLADFLVVDVSKPYAEDSFLEIERSMLARRPHRSGGGRSLNDDVMDTLYTLYVNGGNGPRISDYVDKGTVPASRVFPYLAPPNPYRDPQKPAVKEEADRLRDDHHHQFGRYQLVK